MSDVQPPRICANMHQPALPPPPVLWCITSVRLTHTASSRCRYSVFLWEKPAHHRGAVGVRVAAASSLMLGSHLASRIRTCP